MQHVIFLGELLTSWVPIGSILDNDNPSVRGHRDEIPNEDIAATTGSGRRAFG